MQRNPMQQRTRGFTPSVEDGVAQHGYDAIADTVNVGEERIVGTYRSVAQRAITPSFTAGFTLIEILVAIGILLLILSLGLFLSMDAYRGYSRRSERDVIVSILERARSRAMANVDQKPWGVCYTAPNYVLFSGTSCTSGEDVPAGAGVTVSFPAGGIAFSQLAATTTGGTVTVTQNGKTETIAVNSEGTITW